MEDKEILEKLLEIVKPFVREESLLKDVNKDTQFIQDLNINSSRLVDVVLSLEDTFDIAIEDEEVENLTTVGTVIELVKSKK